MSDSNHVTQTGNGWTGGQYSAYRIVFGLYLLIHFVGLLPWAAEMFSSRGMLPEASTSPLIGLFPNLLGAFDAPGAVVTVVAVAALLSLFFTVGFHDRVAAVLLWYIWACLVGRNPLISNPGIPYIGWLLLAHAFLPAAPFGSWHARGRPDPAGGWHMPSAIFTVAWILMALGYTYGGVTKLTSPSWVDASALHHVLNNPLARPGVLRDFMLALPPILLQLGTWAALGLELAFAPLALFRRVRPWIWLAMLLMHSKLILMVDFVDLSMGMLMLLFFTFDPAWIRPWRAGAEEMLFYDGNCGLCHASVRAVLAEDRTGSAFRFAPLGGPRFLSAVPEDRRRDLPDSLVVAASNGEVLTRSAAVVHIGKRLGGIWRLVSTALGLVPPAVLDLLYDMVASVRYRLFSRPAEACPLLSPALRSRFDD